MFGGRVRGFGGRTLVAAPHLISIVSRKFSSRGLNSPSSIWIMLQEAQLSATHSPIIFLPCEQRSPQIPWGTSAAIVKDKGSATQPCRPQFPRPSLYLCNHVKGTKPLTLVMHEVSNKEVAILRGGHILTSTGGVIFPASFSHYIESCTRPGCVLPALGIWRCAM